MKKAVALFSLLFVINLTACQSPNTKETIHSQNSDSNNSELTEDQILSQITQDFLDSHPGEPEPTVELMEKNGDVSFYKANPDGLGGYILYSGAMNLYRYTKGQAEVEKIEGFLGDFVTDISSDNSLAVGFVTFDGKTSSIGARVTNLKAGSYEDYLIDINGSYQAGNGIFSPDNTKLAFEITYTEVSSEETQIYVVDLQSGKMEQVDSSYGVADYHWEGNSLKVEKQSGLIY